MNVALQSCTVDGGTLKRVVAKLVVSPSGDARVVDVGGAPSNSKFNRCAHQRLDKLRVQSFWGAPIEMTVRRPVRV